MSDTDKIAFLKNLVDSAGFEKIDLVGEIRYDEIPPEEKEKFSAFNKGLRDFKSENCKIVTKQFVVDAYRLYYFIVRRTSCYNKRYIIRLSSQICNGDGFLRSDINVWERTLQKRYIRKTVKRVEICNHYGTVRSVAMSLKDLLVLLYRDPLVVPLVLRILGYIDIEPVLSFSELNDGNQDTSPEKANLNHYERHDPNQLDEEIEMLLYAPFSEKETWDYLLDSSIPDAEKKDRFVDLKRRIDEHFPGLEFTYIDGSIKYYN